MDETLPLPTDAKTNDFQIDQNIDSKADVKFNTLELSDLKISSTGITNQSIEDYIFESTGNGRFKVTDLPISSLDIANKSYVDNYAQGLIVNEAVYVKSTENLEGVYDNGNNGIGATFTANDNAVLEIDGKTPVINARVLIANQIDKKQNGVYVVTDTGSIGSPFVLTRATDLDGTPDYEIKVGTYVLVTNGDTFASTGWVIATPQSLLANPPVVNMTNGLVEQQDWVQFMGSSSNSASNTINVVTTNVIDPNTQYSQIPLSNVYTEFTMANGILGFVKEIQSDKLTDIHIRCDNVTFQLNPRNNRVKLIFIDKWEILSGSTIIKYQQGDELIGTGAIGASQQGASVSVSADGNTLAVGAPADNGNIGAAWIYTRTGTTWTQQGDKLVGTGNVGNSTQGTCVALSSDGNTLAVGGYNDNNERGAAWIFTRTGTTWTQQGDKLVGTGWASVSFQGYGLALSADGDTLAVGGMEDANRTGAVWIFIRTGTTWSQQGSKLVPSDRIGPTTRFGISVALSADGNTLIGGGDFDSSTVGGVWVYTRTGTTWSQQGGRLAGSGNTGGSRQGMSVSVSADGNTFVVGGPLDNSSVGAAWVFNRSGTTWTQQGSKLIGIERVGAGRQGRSVSISADGAYLAVGGDFDDNFNGAIWFYKPVHNVWTQQGRKLTVAALDSNLGVSVRFSAKGTTLAVGGPKYDGFKGAAWVFT